ncbi:MAG: polysaccharide deacetylase family protein [Methylobacter sp.]|nr:polysaccharide deacetylase family protein [Methylobacter sp.]
MKSTLKIKATIKQSIWFIPFIASLLSGCITGLDASYLSGQTATKKTEFMLSFDDGPMPDTTDRVLDILATLKATDGNPVKAGFFLLADAPDEFWQRRVYYAPYELWTDKGSIAKYPKVARRIKQAGHTIGNHTTHHSWFRWPWLDTEESVLSEITEWEAIAKPTLGPLNKRLFRPPYFILTKNVLETTRRLGYQIVMGESVGDATPGMTVDEIKEKTQSILAAWSKPYPCVLTFHDNRPATYEHLDEIVSNLQQQGFRLVHFDSERL